MALLEKNDVFHDRFLIEKLLGEGGMGAVYLAKQLDADRQVAIKIMKDEIVGKEDERARFLREGKVLSQLNNTHIVSFFNFSVDDEGRAYFVFEYLPGKSLRRQLLEFGALSEERAIRVMKQVALALEHAHEQGVVHRDLKPENIMLLETPEPDFVKLVDFGLAGIIKNANIIEQKLTMTGQLVGTPSYMSPEQFKGESASAKSDVYAWGCILYECLIGRPLHNNQEQLEQVEKRENSASASLRNLLKGTVNRNLLHLLKYTLAKNPEQRQLSMKDIISRLERLHDLNAGSLSDSISESDFFQTHKISIGIGVLLLFVTLFLIFGNYLKEQSNRVKSPSVLSAPIKKSPTAVSRDAVKLSTQVASLSAHGKNSEAIMLAQQWLKKYLGDKSISKIDKLTVIAELMKQSLASHDRASFLNYLETGKRLANEIGNTPDDAAVIGRFYVHALTAADGFSEQPQRIKRLAREGAARTSNLQLGWQAEYFVADIANCLISFAEYSDAKNLLEKVNEQLKERAFSREDYSVDSIRILIALGDSQVGLSGEKKVAFKIYENALNRTVDLVKTKSSEAGFLHYKGEDFIFACLASRFSFNSPELLRKSLKNAVEILKCRSAESAISSCSVANIIASLAIQTDNLDIAESANDTGLELAKAVSKKSIYADGVVFNLNWNRVKLQALAKTIDLSRLLEDEKEAIDFSTRGQDPYPIAARVAEIAELLYQRHETKFAEEVLNLASVDLNAAPTNLEGASKPLVLSYFGSALMAAGEKTLAKKNWQNSLAASKGSSRSSSRSVSNCLNSMIRYDDFQLAKDSANVYVARTPMAEAAMKSRGFTAEQQADICMNFGIALRQAMRKTAEQKHISLLRETSDLALDRAIEIFSSHGEVASSETNRHHLIPNLTQCNIARSH